MKSVIERIRGALAAEGAVLPGRGGLAASVEAARAAGVSEAAIARAVAAGLGIEFRESLSTLSPSAEFLNAVPIAFARQHKVLGLMGENDRLLLALGDPAAGLEQ